jgi:serine/threonine protein kinase
MVLYYRENIEKILNLNNLSVCKDLINQNKFEKIAKGIQGEIFKAMSKDCGSIIIKRKIIKEEDQKWKNNEQWLIEELYSEYRIMQLTNRMIDKFLCPNFIKAYDYEKGLLIMEYADGDSKFLFKNEFYETSLYKSYICQVLISLYCFNNYTMLYHCDVKPKNILFKKINENIVFHYKFNNKDYYVPTYGYLFMLADFGNADFKLNGRLPDIENFNYKIINNYLYSFNHMYPDKISKSYLDNFISMLCKKNTKHMLLDKINNLIKFYKLEKNIKINKYVFDLFNILSYSDDALNIINKHYNDFTKNNYDKKNIIDFNFTL